MKEIKVALIQLTDVRDIKDILRGMLVTLKNDETLDRDWLIYQVNFIQKILAKED